MEMQQVTTEEEFKKNPDLKAGDLEQLRGWLQTQQHLPDISDKMLIAFHHSCYFDMTKTKKTIENYYTMRTQAPELFNNRDITSTDLDKCKHVIYIALLPVPDSTGNSIIFLTLHDTEPNNYVPQDCSKLLFMTLDADAIKHGTVPGYHIIFDLQGTKLKHLARLSLSLLRKFILYAEKAMPIRRKTVHVINVPSWIDKLMVLAKPWLSKHTLDNLFFHGDDIESLHKHFPKACLPNELGGVLESVEVFHAANCRTLESLCEYFTEEEKLRVDENKREKTAGGRDEVEIQGTFKQLELD